MDNKEPKDQKSQPPKGPGKWESSIEEAIRQAMEQGLFDNLPGKGKPLNLNRNPYADTDWEMAFHMLQNAGFAPDWIEEEKALRRDEEAARSQLARTWEWFQERLLGARSDGERLRLMAHWQQAQETFRQQTVELNRRIDIFNLKVPILSRHRFRIRPDDEIRKLEQRSSAGTK